MIAYHFSKITSFFYNLSLCWRIVVSTASRISIIAMNSFISCKSGILFISVSDLENLIFRDPRKANAPFCFFRRGLWIGYNFSCAIGWMVATNRLFRFSRIAYLTFLFFPGIRSINSKWRKPSRIVLSFDFLW